MHTLEGLLRSLARGGYRDGSCFGGQHQRPFLNPVPLQVAKRAQEEEDEGQGQEKIIEPK